MLRMLKVVGLTLIVSAQLSAQAQVMPGAGNSTAASIAKGSQTVQAAMDFLVNQAKSLNDSKLRSETLDAINNTMTCIHHRTNVSDSMKNTILSTLEAQGLV